MKSIDFCIPFVGVGLQYAEFLVSNLLATAAYPERISISLNAHTETAVDLIKNSSLNNAVKRIVMAPAYTALSTENYLEGKFVRGGVFGSANHCSATQALFEQTTAEIVIFSDHDMAFLTAGWDLKIIEILETHDLCGVTYQPQKFLMDWAEFPELQQLFGRNYQQTPNLSFLAISRHCIENHFQQGISSFHHYLEKGGLPFQIVNTPQMAEALHLPLGTVWCMDSGCEIPFVIHDKKLKYQTFIPAAFCNQTIFSQEVFIEPTSTGNLPDVFVDSRNGEPILAHFGRGTLKTQLSKVTSFDCFIDSVNGYLTKRRLLDENH